MNYEESAKTAKKTISDFWDKKPCGTEGNLPEKQDAAYFEKIKKRRYLLEPFIFKIADFAGMKGKKALEIGCGIGLDGAEIVLSGAEYTGVDASEKSLELARRRFSLKNLAGNLFLADAENLPFPDNAFDIVYSWGAVHHTLNIKKALEEIHRVLKPDGRFVIMIYNRRSLVGLQLSVIYGLLKLKPFISWKKLFAEHHESKYTQAFTDKETKDLFQIFSEVSIKNIVTPYDTRITRSIFLSAFVRSLIPSGLGFFKIVKGKK